MIVLCSRSGSPYTDSRSGSDYSDDEGGSNKDEGTGGGRSKKGGGGDQFELFEPFSPVNSPDHLFDLSDEEMGTSKQVWPDKRCRHCVHVYLWCMCVRKFPPPPIPRSRPPLQEDTLLKSSPMKRLPLIMRNLTCKRYNYTTCPSAPLR